MRRQDRAMNHNDALEILKKGEYGVLSIMTPDNEPYGIPLSYVLLEDAIYFHGAREGLKLDSINTNEKASFCVVGQTNVLPDKFSTAYESVIVKGEVYVAEDEEKQKALLGLIEKYSKNFVNEGKKYIERSGDATTVIKLLVREISGKARR